MKRITCTAICLALLVKGQTAQAQPWATFFGWTINRSEAGCGMFNNPPETPFALSETVAHKSLFRFPLVSGVLKPNQQFSLLIEAPADAYTAAEARTIEGDTSIGAGGKSAEIMVDSSLLDILVRGGKASVLDRNSGAKIGAIDISTLRDVARVMARCVRELQPSANRGSGKPAVTPPSPRGNMGNWISAIDYPGRALRMNASGTSVISLTVSAIGRVSACNVLKTSGNGYLDEAACVNISRRARFVPSIDEEGVATEGVFTYPVVWAIPK